MVDGQRVKSQNNQQQVTALITLIEVGTQFPVGSTIPGVWVMDRVRTGRGLNTSMHAYVLSSFDCGCHVMSCFKLLLDLPTMVEHNLEL